MTKRSELPKALRDRSFRNREAVVLGASASRLRSADLDRSLWGLRSTSPLVELADRCRTLQLRMPPSSYMSHSTAALLHGMPVPWRLEAASELHLTVPAPSRAPHAAHIRGHRSSAPVHVVTIDGVRVSDAARTWCDLATQLRHEDLIAVGDFLIHWRHPIVSPADLLDAVLSATNRRGKARLARALPSLDGRSESAQESRLRVLLLGQGFTNFTINRHVEDSFGEFVARTDVHLTSLGIILEYMGDYHRTTPGQWRADMTRRSKIEATGKRVMELNADDLRDPAELSRRIWALAALVPH